MQPDVLYIAFTGHDAVLGDDNAYWKAKDFDEFENSIKGLGDTLIRRISSSSSTISRANISRIRGIIVVNFIVSFCILYLGS